MSNSARNPKAQPGVAVDAAGGAVIDPTANVIALNEASIERQDDLRLLTKELHDAKVDHLQKIAEIREFYQEKIGTLRETHQAALRLAESQRLDSIREVDRQDVNKTAGQIFAAVATLQTTANTTAETLRAQVTSTANALQTTFNNITADFNKRLSALELSSSEGKGKQTLADPQLLDLLAEVKSLRDSRTSATGHQTGGADTWKWVALLIGVIASVLLILSRIP